MTIFSHDTLVIAEVAQAHDGSLGYAHAYIDAVARAGAGGVKFQTHIAVAESSKAEPWRVKFSPQDDTRYDYWRRMQFTDAQWAGLKEHAEDRGLLFLSSPFSVEAVELLERLGVKAYKVASGEVSNPLLVDKIIATSKPIILSTGMSSLEELDRVVDRIPPKTELAVLQCTSKYPVRAEEVGLNLLVYYRMVYRCWTGISDHSGTIFPGLAAVTLGASVVEVHVTFSRECFGPDVAASLTTAELAQLVEGVRFIRRAMDNPVDKDGVAQELVNTRKIFGKSLVASSLLEQDSTLTIEKVTAKKSGGIGIPASALNQYLGRKLTQEVEAGAFLQEGDFA